MKKAAKPAAKGGSPSDQIDARIQDLDDWRGERLAEVRALIRDTVPGVVEEWKWRGTPVWEQNGMICTGETYKDKVKFTFAQGARLKDPTGLFNSSLEGNQRRAIDFFEKDKVDKKALAALIKAAVELNGAKPARKKAGAAQPVAKKAAKKKAAKKRAAR